MCVRAFILSPSLSVADFFFMTLYSTCGLAEELAGDEKRAKPATSSCGNVSSLKKIDCLYYVS